MKEGFFEVTSRRAPSNVPRLPYCGRCGLSSKCISPRMPATGKGKHKILFVAEAPGRNEDEQGVQLVGDAGQELRRLLRQTEPEGIDLDDCTKTNAIICRPPKNKLLPLYVECCRPNLLRTIKQVRPNVIVLLGGPAVQSLIEPEWGESKGALAKWVGWTIPSHTHQAWICPTYHPSFLIRMGRDNNADPLLALITKRHLQNAIDLEAVPIPSETLETFESQVEIITSPRQGRMRMRELAKKKGRLAFDFETNGLKPDRQGSKIFCASFCLGGQGAFACAITEESYPVLSSVLRNPRLKKVAANLKFEGRWTKALLGHRVRGWFWDTMLAAHLLDNRRGITSLKFQAYVQFGLPDYSSHLDEFLKGPGQFNKIHKAPLRELLLYNGLDSLLTFALMIKQRREMAVGIRKGERCPKGHREGSKRRTRGPGRRSGRN